MISRARVDGIAQSLEHADINRRETQRHA